MRGLLFKGFQFFPGNPLESLRAGIMHSKLMAIVRCFRKNGWCENLRLIYGNLAMSRYHSNIREWEMIEL